jgi:hypothetical protein
MFVIFKVTVKVLHLKKAHQICCLACLKLNPLPVSYIPHPLLYHQVKLFYLSSIHSSINQRRHFLIEIVKKLEKIIATIIVIKISMGFI